MVDCWTGGNDSIGLLSLGNQAKETAYVAIGLKQFNKLGYN